MSFGDSFVSTLAYICFTLCRLKDTEDAMIGWNVHESDQVNAFVNKLTQN